MGVRGPLCQTLKKGVEDLATVVSKIREVVANKEREVKD
jgi:hypothetical protein